MSAVPAIDTYVETPAVRVAASTTVAAPASRSRRKTNVASEITSRLMVFGFVASVAFLTSTLTGHVMVEKARRDSIRAVERASAASREASILRQRVESLTSARAVDDWARRNGFFATDEAAQTSGGKNLVALKD